MDTSLPVLEPVKVWLYPGSFANSALLLNKGYSPRSRCVRGSWTCNSSSRVRKSISCRSRPSDLEIYNRQFYFLLENLSKHFKRNTMLGSQPQTDMPSILLSGSKKTLQEVLHNFDIYFHRWSGRPAEPFGLRAPFGLRPLADNKPWIRTNKKIKIFLFLCFHSGTK